MEFFENRVKNKTKDFRKDFSIEESYINLNSGTLSKSPLSVINAKFAYYQDYEKNTTKSLFNTWEKLWKVQAQLAKWLGTEAEDLFLRNNVTFALNDLILGFNTQKGELIYTDLEYGAIINIMKLKAKNEGHTLKSIPLSEFLFEVKRNCIKSSFSPEIFNNDGLNNPTMRIHEADLEDQIVAWFLDQISEETRLILVSHVISMNGLIMPIEKLSIETRKRNILLVVDGAHSVGSLPLNLSLFTCVDGYAGNLHKWMMAPKGCGFGWLNPIHQLNWRPIQGSWTVFETLEWQKSFGGGSRFAAQMLHSSCMDFSSWYAITDIINYWDENTPQAIRKKLFQLQLLLRTTVHEQLPSWVDISPASNLCKDPYDKVSLDNDPQNKVSLDKDTTEKSSSLGPLLAFLPNNILIERFQSNPANLLFGLLKEFHLQLHSTFNPKGQIVLRFSPHIYNSENEILRALEILSQISS